MEDQANLDEQIPAIEKLIRIISPTEALVAEHIANLREALTSSGEDNGAADGTALMRCLKDVIDWHAGFYVDWNDTESLVGSVEEICARWDVAIDWGVEDPYADDFLNAVDVCRLLELAHRALLEQGYTLWNWNTQSDAYAGWLAPSHHDGDVMAIADRLGVEMRPASKPF